MENIISANNIHKSYFIGKKKETIVLKGLTLDVKHGEYLAIVGPSGAGKSTLLYVMGSLEKPDDGNITLNINGSSYHYEKLDMDTMAHLRNRHIGFVFQFHHLLPEFTALENVMIPGFIAGKGKKEAQERAEYLMETTGVIDRADHKPAELSGGEQQRVAIARALINDPTIVLADEPTGNLDSKNSDAVLDLIAKMREEYNLTFVVATHSRDVAERGERIITIQDGKIA